MNTHPELQKVFEPNTQKKKPEVKKQVPATPYQILAERLLPLVSMLVLFGLLQVLSAFYYHPLQSPTGFANVAGIAVVTSDMPFAIQVRNSRIGLGMSRRALAQKVGLTLDNIANIEEGDATPTREVEYAIRQVLGLKTILEDDVAGNP